MKKKLTEKEEMKKNAMKYLKTSNEFLLVSSDKLGIRVTRVSTIDSLGIFTSLVNAETTKLILENRDK